MGFEHFDMGTYQKKGFLSEKDYNILSRKLVDAFNPIRVPNIRKNMDFSALTYTDYSKEELIESLDEGSFSVPLELNSISIPLITSFNSNYFPNFELEYTNPSVILDFIDDTVYLEEIQNVALKHVLNSNYHSLAITAYDLEKAIKEAFKKSNLWKVSENVSVLVEFFIPARISCNFDITIKIIFTFYVD